MSILYFIIVIGPSYLVERKILKRPGYVSFASASLAGVALSIPSMAASSNELCSHMSQAPSRSLPLFWQLPIFWLHSL